MPAVEKACSALFAELIGETKHLTFFNKTEQNLERKKLMQQN
jgi:hypothetical protein